ncbi:Malic enzyme [Giardia lamblia P15]|uniref:Malic enzyme n=1 Tax=Giardia intestinalis (strain P15) TaxID=658858 RepID=E1F7L3_GIAIA|nr:Malic enzyme [Giardia lamblia P15]
MPITISTVLRNKDCNKDTAFTVAEREAHHIVARLPAKVETIEQQISRCRAQFDALTTPIEKWLYLTRLQEINESLFSGFCLKYLKEVLPIVYTPTVGTACSNYSLLWQSYPRGFYLNRTHLGKVRQILDQWPYSPRIIVATDGTRILGLGDLGTGGHQICVGKLTLYSLGGGFAPEHTLPISFDFGCNTDKIREDPHYLGIPEKRNKDDVYYGIIKETIEAVHSKWPDCIFQFEDFSNDTAFTLLEKHRDTGPVFNDDIQGTGCIAAATIAAGLRAISLKANRIAKASEQVYVMFGAGAGGIGVADNIASLSVSEGYTLEQARKQFYVIDSQGLLTADREDFVNGTMPKHKLPYVRHDLSIKGHTTLLSVIKAVKPTCLLGLSTVAKSFTHEILETMCKGLPADQPPIILALSNPTEKCECTFEECMKYTNNTAYYASGSPMPSLTLPNGTTIQPAQCNNFYVFPGIGLGAYVCRAKKITDEMITGVSGALAQMVPEEKLRRGELLPDLDEIREISCQCALGLIRVAEKQGHSRRMLPSSDTELLAQLKDTQWSPKY